MLPFSNGHTYKYLMYMFVRAVSPGTRASRPGISDGCRGRVSHVVTSRVASSFARQPSAVLGCTCLSTDTEVFHAMEAKHEGGDLNLNQLRSHSASGVPFHDEIRSAGVFIPCMSREGVLPKSSQRALEILGRRNATQMLTAGPRGSWQIKEWRRWSRRCFARVQLEPSSVESGRVLALLSNPEFGAW